MTKLERTLAEQAEEFVCLATEDGFLVTAGREFDWVQDDALTISQRIQEPTMSAARAEGLDQTATKARATSLLGLVPRLGSMRGMISFDARAGGAGGLGVYLMVKAAIRGVEPGFLIAVANLEIAANGALDEREMSNLGFDSKVAEEVEQNPEILGMQKVIDAYWRTGGAMLEALKARKAEMIVEREGLRGSYRYVTSEREL